MEDEKSTGSVAQTIDAVTGLVKAVPVYEDAVRPAAKEVGKALETAGKAVNLALSPVRGLIWGYEKFEKFLSERVGEKMVATPVDRITTPKPNIAVTAIESLRLTGDDENLQDLYANLLASSMDVSMAKGVFPCFVDILKQLTPDEAKLLRVLKVDIPLPYLTISVRDKGHTAGFTLMKTFSHYGVQAGCENEEFTPIYLDNFVRLGIIEMPQYLRYTGEGVYDELLNDQKIKDLQLGIEQVEGKELGIDMKSIIITELGKKFIEVCVDDYSVKQLS